MSYGGDNATAVEVFNSTIHESKLYTDRLKAAFHDRFEWNTINRSGGAITWVSLAGTALRVYSNTFADGKLEFTVKDRLQLAILLSDYYATHIEEFSVEERIATAKSIGLPGLRVDQ